MEMVPLPSWPYRHRYSRDIPLMAAAFKQAVEAGRAAYLAGPGRVLEQGAAASSPLTGFLEDR